MPKRRLREEGNVDVQLVEIYEDLASNVESVRVNAAKALIRRLSVEPESFEKILQRLFRGLASGRKSARIGFSIALTEAIRIGVTETNGQSQTTIARVIEVLEASTKISKDAKGQESRDHYLGRIFGLAAIVQSGVLFTKNENIPLWEKLIALMFVTSRKKVWLREECGWILYQSVKTLKTAPGGDEYVRKLLDYLTTNAQAKTPEGIAIWIAVQQHFPHMKLPKNVFRHQDPLNRKEKVALARILKQSSTTDETNETESTVNSGKLNGAWSSKPHFAWDVVFTAAFQPAEKQVTFADLWREAVDESLFSMKASPERKYWGFLLFQRYVLSAPGAVIPCLFGSNLLGTLKYQLRSEEQSLNALAVDVVDSIVARSLEDKESIAELVFGFLSADINFDRFAKTKPVEKLVGRADLDTLQRIVLRITDEIEQLAGGEEEEDRHGLTSLADILVSVFRSHNFAEAEEDNERYRPIVNTILGTFVQQAFVSKRCTQATQDMFKQRLLSSLNHITAKDPKPAYHPCSAIAMIRRNMKNTDLDADPQVLEAIEQGSTLLAKVEMKETSSKSEDRKKTMQAFELLLSFAILQAYSGEAESVNTIDDLRNCYKSLIKHRSKDDDSEDAVALVEIIVEFVSKPSALYRRLAPKILTAFSDRVNEEGLDAMLKILNTPESTSGQAELFSKGDEDAMDVDNQSGSDSEDSDVEVVDAEAEDGSESDASGSENSSASDGSPEADPELEAFDAQLAAALGTRSLDAEAGEGDDDSESDSDVSDGAMEALDAQLGAIFKQRIDAKQNSTPKQQRRGARDSIVNFKTKILELLEAYIKKEYQAVAALHLVVPVLQGMHYTNNASIAQRSCELIRQFTKLYKLRTVEQDRLEAKAEAEAKAEGGGEGEGTSKSTGESKGEPLRKDPVRRDAALDVLNEVHALVHNATSSMQAKACTSASLLATKVYLSQGGSLHEVTAIYDRTKGSLAYEGEFKFRQRFLEDWLNWRTQAEKNGQLQGR